MKRHHDARMLIHQQAKAFYDRPGARQDLPAFYEAPATLSRLQHHLPFKPCSTCHILLEKRNLSPGSKGTGSAGKSGRQPEAIVSCERGNRCARPITGKIEPKGKAFDG
jgi:hypothetical protein